VHSNSTDPGRRKRPFATSALVLLSLVVTFGVIEGFSRITIPLSPGARNLSLSGEELESITSGPYRYVAGLTFRQVSDEFDVRVTIDDHGNRISPPTPDPKLVFLGDSFTFGHGLDDKATFPWIYCTRMKARCANLGRSGSGTFVQLGVLREYLDREGWRPSEVKLFVLAMTAALASGNDLLDNWYFVEVENAKRTVRTGDLDSLPQPVTAPGRVDFFLVARRWLLTHSNLARVIYFASAPYVRAWATASPASETITEAKAATRRAFTEFADLGRQYGFRTAIYVLFPVQDLLHGTHVKTTQDIRELAGNIPVYDVGAALSDRPTAYYFAYDGHYNAAGAARIAEAMAEVER
jgi:hypothetical protein